MAHYQITCKCGAPCPQSGSIRPGHEHRHQDCAYEERPGSVRKKPIHSLGKPGRPSSGYTHDQGEAKHRPSKEQDPRMDIDHPALRPVCLLPVLCIGEQEDEPEAREPLINRIKFQTNHPLCLPPIYGTVPRHTTLCGSDLRVWDAV